MAATAVACAAPQSDDDESCDRCERPVCGSRLSPYESKEPRGAPWQMTQDKTRRHQFTAAHKIDKDNKREV